MNLENGLGTYASNFFGWTLSSLEQKRIELHPTTHWSSQLCWIFRITVCIRHLSVRSLGHHERLQFLNTESDAGHLGPFLRESSSTSFRSLTIAKRPSSASRVAEMGLLSFLLTCLIFVAQTHGIVRVFTLSIVSDISRPVCYCRILQDSSRRRVLVSANAAMYVFNEPLSNIGHILICQAS
jgi:hypothetical protein